MLKFFGHLLKALFWLSLVVLLSGLVILYLLERDIPAPLVQRLSNALSNKDVLIRVDRATYSLRGGLRLHHIEALPKRVAASALVSADEIAIDLSLQPGLPATNRIRGVTIRNIAMPSLPHKEHKGGQDSEPKPKKDLKLPDLPPFPLTVENTDILGIRARRLSATVSVQPKRLSVSGIHIDWPNPDVPMSVTGDLTVDLTSSTLSGHAQGQAFPDNLMPLFKVLRAHGAIEQIECFSGLQRPVDADYTFDVNLDNTDFAMTLGLDVGPCAYRGVPMESAKGTLYIYGTNIYTSVEVRPVEGKSASGPIGGKLFYHEQTESLDLDASAEMDMPQLMQVLHLFRHGELDRIRCDTPVRVTAKGVAALSAEKSTVSNALAGTIAFQQGSILNLRLRDVTGDYSVQGYSALFDNIKGTSSSGGTVTGDIRFDFPGYASTATVFTTHVNLADVELADLSHACNITNERAGLVSGKIRLDGQADKRTLETLSGEGNIRIRNGQLHRMRLFAGFTDYLVKTIPGVSALVTQSSGSMDFTIRDGVLSTDNLLVEGDLFSMNGRGTYNLATDKFNFVVRANIFKQKTIAGKITRLVTLPFSRLLLEFKVFGSLEDPDWSYVNILEKISDQFSETPQPTPPSNNTP